MNKLKWYQYMAIAIGIMALFFIVAGIIGENGTLIFVGIAMIVGGTIPLFTSKNKAKTKQVEK